MSDRVLVTGVSGFLGGHVAQALLDQGFTVRGSLRDLARADGVRADLAKLGGDVSRLEFCTLDLLRDDGWTAAVKDCRYVQHTASPFVLTMPKDENDLIRPAVGGTRRAVQAALDAGVERIVLTSSVAAIDGGHHRYDRELGPSDWTDIDGPRVTAYTKSKTLAEREAWSLAERAGARNRLSVINPGTMLGPLNSDDPGTSAFVILRMLKGAMPMLPDLILPYVDVRDVAAAHVAAMTSTPAAGTRIIVTNPAIPLVAIAETLRSKLGSSAAKVPTRRMPTWLANIFALFDDSLRDGKTYLGIQRRYDASGARALLGRDLRSTAEAVEATARSLIGRRLV